MRVVGAEGTVLLQTPDGPSFLKLYQQRRYASEPANARPSTLDFGCREQGRRRNGPAGARPANDCRRGRDDCGCYYTKLTVSSTLAGDRYGSRWVIQLVDRVTLPPFPGRRGEVLLQAMEAASCGHSEQPISPTTTLPVAMLTWLKRQGIDDGSSQSYSGHASRNRSKSIRSSRSATCNLRTTQT